MAQKCISAWADSEASPQPIAAPPEHLHLFRQSPSERLDTEFRALLNSRVALSSALSGLGSRHLDVKLIRWNLKEAMGELETALTYVRDRWIFPPHGKGAKIKQFTNNSGMERKAHRALWEQGKGYCEEEDGMTALDAEHDTHDAPREDAGEVFSVSDGGIVLTPTISDTSAGTVRADESEKDDKVMHEREKRDPSTADAQMIYAIQDLADGIKQHNDRMKDVMLGLGDGIKQLNLHMTSLLRTQHIGFELMHGRPFSRALNDPEVNSVDQV